MAKFEDRHIERRKYIRLPAPIRLTYTNVDSGRTHNADVKDISPEGVRFETQDKALGSSDNLELKLDIPNAPNSVHAKGTVVWKEKLSLEDTSPFDFGIEFSEIEDDNKNTFLKFLCDLIYNLPEGARHGGKKVA